jgi:hypothetical protein
VVAAGRRGQRRRAPHAQPRRPARRALPQRGIPPTKAARISLARLLSGRPPRVPSAAVGQGGRRADRWYPPSPDQWEVCRQRGRRGPGRRVKAGAARPREPLRSAPGDAAHPRPQPGRSRARKTRSACRACCPLLPRTARTERRAGQGRGAPPGPNACAGRPKGWGSTYPHARWRPSAGCAPPMQAHAYASARPSRGNGKGEARRGGGRIICRKAPGSPQERAGRRGAPLGPARVSARQEGRSLPCFATPVYQGSRACPRMHVEPCTPSINRATDCTLASESAQPWLAAQGCPRESGIRNSYARRWMDAHASQVPEMGNLRLQESCAALRSCQNFRQLGREIPPRSARDPAAPAYPLAGTRRTSPGAF